MTEGVPVCVAVNVSLGVSVLVRLDDCDSLGDRDWVDVKLIVGDGLTVRNCVRVRENVAETLCVMLWVCERVTGVSLCEADWVDE